MNPAWSVERVCELIGEAGRIALSYFEEPEIERKADFSVVTAADRAIEARLQQEFDHPEEGYFLIGEETIHLYDDAYFADALRRSCWVVDPIDGTAPYANKLPTWGVSIGYMEEGRLTEGALFLPRTGDLIITDGDEVLYERGSRNPKRWTFTALERLDPGPQPYTPSGMISLPQEIRREARFEGRNPFQATGSAVYSVVKLVLGGYLGYIARIKLWDLGASIPILRRLGYSIVMRDGTEMDERVIEEFWHLSPESPRRWKSKDLLFIAKDAETIRFMRESYKLPR
ncbi:MAG: inositol monophosphatase family protein [Spirochaetaceae bacterium]